MSDFSDEDARWLTEAGLQRSVASGEAIIAEGRPVAHLFFILSGSFLVTSSALSVPLRPRLGPGEIAGEIAYIHKQLPLATVTAEVPSVVLCLPHARLDVKIAEDAGFAARFYRVVSEFASERLTQWMSREAGDAPHPAADDAERSLAKLRVHELIEKMLRGELP